ncbi:MAG: NIL domain-containing protein [Phycisphaerae bacterium]
MAKVNKRVWLTFGSRSLVEKPILWQMARQYPDVSFDIRQASVTAEIGIMAVLFEGEPDQVAGALDYLKSRGLTVEPIEKNMIES